MRSICNRGIPVVHVGVEVLKEKQREFSAFAEPAIGKSNSVGFNESCRRGFMRIAAHIGFFLLSVSICQLEAVIIPVTLQRQGQGLIAAGLQIVGDDIQPVRECKITPNGIQALTG